MSRQNTLRLLPYNNHAVVLRKDRENNARRHKIVKQNIYNATLKDRHR